MLRFLTKYPEVVLCSLIACVALAKLRTRGRQRTKAELLLLAAAFGIAGTPLAQWTLARLSALRPWKLDPYIFRLDGLLGFQPSFAVGVLVNHLPWLAFLCGVSYYGLPAVYVGVFALHLKTRSFRDAGEVAAAFALNLFASLPIYLLFPVCGPAYAFPGFPYQVPLHVAAQAIQISAPPNGVPSVHFSSALLILWFLRPWRWGIVFGLAFLAITTIATLGSGEHYAFDLVVAVPYAVVVAWAANRLVARIAPQQDAAPKQVAKKSAA